MTVPPESSAAAETEPISAPAAVGAQRQTSNGPMWLLGAVVLTDQIDQSILRGVLETLRTEFGLSDLQLGFLASCFILVNGLVTIPAGYLADRWRRTRALGNTMLAWSAVTALTAASQSYGHLVAARSALGFGQAVTEPSVNSLMADYYPTSQRGRAFSVLQVMYFLGAGLGVGLGGIVAATWGWRWAFLVVGSPSVVVALLVFRMREPRRGMADRMHLGVEDDEEVRPPGLLDEGVRVFIREMARGLVADLKTIAGIPTMRYILAGAMTLIFSITGILVWLPSFYERQLEVAGGLAQAMVGGIVIFGGVPGVIVGGRLVDTVATRFKGGRVAFPAVCIMAFNTFFVLSYLPILPVPATYGLQVVGFFVVSMAAPALRAGLSDAVPANLRGAGFGAFNLVSVLGGQALAPLAVSVLALGGNLRTAFLILSPMIYVGALIMFQARHHLDRDAAKIFEAIADAMREEEERQQAALERTERPED